MTQVFHTALDGITEDLIRMAASVTESIPRGTEVLLTGDLQGADSIIRGDLDINTRALDLEERCYGLLARNQPMASDLRRIVTQVKMIGEIERSGDLVVNICKAARRIYGQELDPRLRGLIARMGDQATHLYRLAIDAFSEKDAALANAIGDIDDVLDALHAEFIRAIFECHKSGSVDLQLGVQLALIGRFYERISDHAVNIGERVCFMVTGDLPSPEPVGIAPAEPSA